MKTIIAFTDSVTECECCGKKELKGTYCLTIEGEELYYGSTCAFKAHGVTVEEQKKAKKLFTAEQKNQKLIEAHIDPIKSQLQERLEDTFTDSYENLTEIAKEVYQSIVESYERMIEYKAKKYKINI